MSHKGIGDLEEKVSFLHRLVFPDVDLDHLAFDPGGHLNDVGLEVGVRGERGVAVRQLHLGPQHVLFQGDAPLRRATVSSSVAWARRTASSCTRRDARARRTSR